MQLKIKDSSACTEEEVHDIILVASLAFGQDISENFLQDVRSHILASSEVVLAYKDKHLAGFCLSKGIQNILYISGVCVSPKFQNMGVGCTMLKKTIIASPYNFNYVI